MQESRKCVARPRDATVVRPTPLYNLYALHISSPCTSLVDLLLIVLLCADDDCALATCGTSQDTCTQGWCHNDGHGSVTFRIRGDGDGDESLLWSHHAQGDDGMSCFEIDLTEAGSSTIEFSVSSDGRRSCDTASWGDLKACQADSCASVASCEECNGRCGWCTAGRGQPGRCSSECQSGPNACHIGGGH
eukprot:COSAG02_NODE_2614_length_8415_cov_84.832011_6_plen_190_part_00